MIIAEYVKDGYTHSDFNASMVSIYGSIIDDEEIHLFCGKKHYEVIYNLLLNNNISTDRIIYHELKPSGDFVREYKLLFADYSAVKTIFNFAKQHNENKIVFLYTTTFMLYFVKLFSCIYPAIKTIVSIHSELERIDIIEYAKTFSKNRLVMFLYALFLGIKIPLMLPTPKNLKYLVYGESIRENAVKKIPQMKGKTIAIPLPYLYTEMENHIPNSECINFGVVGISAKRKNTPLLTRIIKHLSNKEKINFKMSFSGKILDDEFFELVSNLDWVNKNELSKTMISSELRNQIIKNIDYVLYTYKIGSYKYIASGVLFDCINYEKPLIALKTDYIEHYFKKYGNIGYIFDTYEELEKKVDEILNNFPEDEYKIQISNLKRIKSEENVAKISNILKKECEEFFM